tara:strand:- start:478 stop:645 length:168 start_codon:yes stop_codon:yes gene_type:complete
MTITQLRTAAQNARSKGDRAEVSRLVALAVAKLHAPTRAPLASLAGHVRIVWGVE